MKKSLIVAICASTIAAQALPTYEPFTEYATQATATGTNAVDLATGGFSAPSGEAWGALNFAGTAGTGIKGLDIDVTNVSSGSPFTTTALSSLLPTTFPGYPTGSAITTYVINPAQAPNANTVGNSAVLKFAQDLVRPTNGQATTLYVSYLFSVAQKGQTGAGNIGRYLGFLESTNLVEGTNQGTVAYTNWASLFNTFGATPKYFGHGVFNGAPEYIEPCDNAKGIEPPAPPTTFQVAFGAPAFIVGQFYFQPTSLSPAKMDTNTIWVNPAVSSFGGPTPPTSPVNAFAMTNMLTDVGGLVLIDRVGSGASGGVGTNYIANLIIGKTWSYVTGGPEFTTEPIASAPVNVGQNITLTASAVAAGQTVNYQWQKVSSGVTNSVNDGPGGAGGTATVSGSSTASLTLTSLGAGDVGTYQVVATASGTLSSLISSTSTLALADPQIVSSPASVVTNYGQSVTFTAQVNTVDAPLNFRWYLGTTPLNNGTQPDGSVLTGASGTTGAGTSFSLSLTLNNVTYQGDGSYTLFVTNSLNLENPTTPATLTVNDPYIITEPTAQAVPAGGTAHFTVSAAGSPTVNYQWFEDGTQLGDGGTPVNGTATVSGSSSPTLTLTGVTDADDGNYYAIITSGSGQDVISTTNSFTAIDQVAIATPPMSLTERVGDHVAFEVSLTGQFPTFQWSFNGTPIPNATNSAVVVTNIQTTNAGTYSVVFSNPVSSPQTASATLTVVNSTVLPFSSTNIVVARVGDGAQALSGATGNTIYFDQYTPAGVYVNTAQVPDENTNQAYGTGSAASVFGSPAMLAQGTGADAPNGLYLTLSSGNQEYLNFAAYCAQYPFSGADVTIGATGGAFWRGLGTLNAFGIYSLAYTNSGLYSGGGHTIRSMVTADNTNFWTTGQAGSGSGVKFVTTTNAAIANGSGILSITSSAAAERVIQIVGTNLVFSDPGGVNGSGLYACAGTPEPASGAPGSTLILNQGGQPTDFAVSPDGQTIYITDTQEFNGTNNQGSGGIQRWDTNTSGSGWNYSYTLQPLAGTTNGADAVTVDFSANATWGAMSFGAKIYATTYGPNSNSLVAIVDNGPASVAVPIVTAGLNQALRGVRFGPAAVPVAFAKQPSSVTNFPANSVTFTAVATGSQPIFYQWQFNGVDIPGATQSTFTTNNISFASGGNYSVIISNLVPAQVISSNALLTVTAGAPTFTTPVQSWVEGEGEHLAFSPVVTGSQPIAAQWYFATTNNPIAGATNIGLVLTNIQPGQSGTYLLYVNNIFGTNHSAGTLNVTVSPSALSSNNIIVSRVGDGIQPLSGATGNTIYLDQYTTGGAYVNTLQIPDEGTGQPYGTGGASSASLPFGSPALLIAGGNTDNDAALEGLLTLSGDGTTLNFAGYVEAYPFSGADLTVGANAGANWRGIGSIDAFGAYSLVYTNTGLYSGGNHQIHSAVTADQTNYWTTGEAGSVGVKYVTPSFQPASGGGIPAVGGSDTGTRQIQIINNSLVFSDAGASPPGIYTFGDEPNNTATPSVLITETNSPLDFAESPDAQTIYIADNSTFVGTSVQGGGIERWDTDVNNGGYAYSYTLGTGAGSTFGARGLTVDFSAHSTWGATVTGAVLFATTAEPAGNRLIKIVDNGASSSAAVLATTSLTNALAGVRFGPAAIPASIAVEPQDTTVLVGSGASFSVVAGGTAPFFYQWQFNGANLSGATQPTLNVSAAQAALPGNYTVIVSNLAPPAATSAPASIAFVPVLGFNGNGSGWARNGTGGLPIYNFDSNSNDVELTQSAADQASATFYSEPVYVGGFLATWTYQVLNPSGTLADGIAFVVQNDPRGPQAIGGDGGSFGYNGIADSAALELNLYTNAASGTGIAFDTGGTIGPNVNPLPVVLGSGDPINVTLQYVNGVASLNLLDTTTGDAFSTNAHVNVPAAVHSTQAYVGFTGGDGAQVSTQVVSNFVFVSLINLTATNTGSNTLALTWPTGVGAYTVQKNTDLTTANWVNVTNAITVVNGANETIVPLTVSNVYYRLVIP